LAALTMLLGNLVALAQRNLKRLMAYSSIGHAGFILAGIAALSTSSDLASNGVMFYLVGYSITNLVVFAAIISFFNMTGKEMIADLGGLADHQPFLAASLGMGLFSLAGLPIFAGFTMKFYLFTAVATEGFLWLAGIAVFSSLISLYYYLQVLRQMYIEPVPAGDGGGDMLIEHPSLARRPSLPLLTVLGSGVAAILWLGVYPKPLIEVIEAASRAVMP
jgi:NADH-quinone oxidoreductase subunit N